MFFYFLLEYTNDFIKDLNIFNEVANLYNENPLKFQESRNVPTSSFFDNWYLTYHVFICQEVQSLYSIQIYSHRKQNEKLNDFILYFDHKKAMTCLQNNVTGIEIYKFFYTLIRRFHVQHISKV